MKAIYTCLLLDGKTVRIHGHIDEQVCQIKERCARKHGPVADVVGETRIGRDPDQEPSREQE